MYMLICMVNQLGNRSHGPSSFMDCSSKCVIHGSKSEWWVVNSMILLRQDQVVNQVVNRRLMLKQTWMCPGIQGPRERTEWRDNPYLWIIPANLDHNKFHSWIIPATCVIRGSKSEWRWVVNPTILLRWDQVVNQVVNKRLMLKQMQMCPGIQEPRERTKWWRDNPYLWIVPADIDCSKFYSWIVPVNEGSKEEGGKENMLVSSRHCH